MNDLKNHGAGKPVQSSPRASRAVTKSSGPAMVRESPHVAGLGGGSSIPPRAGSPEALAHPLPAGTKARCFLWEAAAQAVRVVGTPDQPWFVAKDVCAALGIEWKGSGSIGPLDEDEKGAQIVSTLGGDQELLTINESGLYALIFQSRKAQAKLFRKWVTSEVLPAIRKTGQYQAAPGPVSPSVQLRLENANKVISIYEVPAAPQFVVGEEAMVASLIREVLAVTHSYRREETIVYAHTIIDVARRDEAFALWFGRHTNFQGNARFMKNMSRFFNRALVLKVDEEGGNYEFMIVPAGRLRHRRYILSGRHRRKLVETAHRVDAEKAVAIVSRALAAGSEVVVK